jgi:crossover junction endodeoxyribonuclease RuvC
MTHKTPLCVVGVDPGLNTTGYGVLDVTQLPPRLVEAGVVRGGRPDRLDLRLLSLHRGLSEVLKTHCPQSVALEELYSHYQRPRTAILMGHARGVICLAAAELDLPLHHYAATHVKKLLTGSGRAPKDQVQVAVRRELRLTQIPEPPDVADALAIALCHAYSQFGRSAFSLCRATT